MDVTLGILHEYPWFPLSSQASLCEISEIPLSFCRPEQSLEKARTQEEEFDSNLVFLDFYSYWIQVEATPVRLDKWSAYLCNLLLC